MTTTELHPFVAKAVDTYACAWAELPDNHPRHALGFGPFELREFLARLTEESQHPWIDFAKQRFITSEQVDNAFGVLAITCRGIIAASGGVASLEVQRPTSDMPTAAHFGIARIAVEIGDLSMIMPGLRALGDEVMTPSLHALVLICRQLLLGLDGEVGRGPGDAGGAS